MELTRGESGSGEEKRYRERPSSPHLRECIDDCRRCQESCLSIVSYALSSNIRDRYPHLIKNLIVCAESCDGAAEAMLLDSDLHVYLCRACAEICAVCAQECVTAGDEAMVSRCAEDCRRCEQSCRHLGIASIRG